MHRHIRLAIVASGLLLAGCGIDGPPPQASSGTTTSTTTTKSETSTTTTTPPPPPTPQVMFACYLDDTFTNPMSFRIPVGGDFTTIWAVQPRSCEVTREPGELTRLEQTAVAAAGYTDQTGIGTLYELCGQVDPDDVYVSPEHALSPEQITEVNGMLTLCPKHPQATQLKDAVARGHAHAKAEAAGELFYAGTFLVGSEVKPGIYAVEGEIENCYWERTDARGEIIDNGFLLGARRVEVTIRSSDYSFHSEGCGEWRKVG